MASSFGSGSEWVMVEPEWEKAQRHRRLQNLTLALKCAFGAIVAMIIYIYLNRNGTSCGDPRFAKMEHRVRGLQNLWASPADLEAKYARLVAEFDKHLRQVDEMALIYRNITEVKKLLGDVQMEIDEVQSLRGAGSTATESLKRTLGDIDKFTDNLDSRLQDGLKNVSLDAAALSKKFIVPAVEEMRKDVSADETQSRDALKVDFDNHWRLIDSKMSMVNASLLQETSTMLGSLSSKANALSKAINAEVATSTAPVTKALALASQAKNAGDEAINEAKAAVASLDGVGFVKMAGADCPQGSKQCTLWSWFNPQLMDPYCSGKADTVATERADGSCKAASNGELQNQLWGCCRDTETVAKENLV